MAKKMSLFIYDYYGEFLTFAQMENAEQKDSFRSFADAIGVTDVLIEEATISMTAKGPYGLEGKNWYDTEAMSGAAAEEFHFEKYNKDGTMFIRLKETVSKSVINVLKNRRDTLTLATKK